MTEIGIVGAGVAGAAAAFALDRRLSDPAITVLEQSASVGGRAATRHRGDCTYEYGANYATSDDERVVELLTETLDDEGLVDVTEPIYTFDESGTVSPGRDADGRKWTYRAGISQVATRLLDRSKASVHRRTRVDSIEQLGGVADETRTTDDGAENDERDAADSAARWRLRDADGERWGPFDALVLTPPAPRTAALLETADWEHPARTALAGAAAAIPYRTIWTAVLHYEFELDVPYYALVNTDREHEVGWLAREECKPGHVPDGETLLIVQASPAWSTEHVDEPADATVAALADHAADLLDDERIRDPDWTDHECWRHALPDEGIDVAALRATAAEGLYCAGDWVAGEARVHAAIATGLDVADRVVDAASES